VMEKPAISMEVAYRPTQGLYTFTFLCPRISAAFR
jgi:hypothetical protein